MGFIADNQQIVLEIYSEVFQKFRLAAEGHGLVQRPDELRERIVTCFDPLPLWYLPLEEQAIDQEAFPLHAVTQRPMAMYHSWDSQNAWQRQIHARNALYCQSALNIEPLSACNVDPFGDARRRSYR